MHYKKVRLDDIYNEVEIVLLSDLHVGSEACDMDLIKRVIDYIAEKDNRRCLLLGDAIENGTKNSIGSGVYEQLMNPQDQIDLVVELLKPIAHKLDISISGNHEERSRVQSGLDAMKIISDQLGIEYAGYRAVVDYTINKNSYKFAIHHGKGGGGTLATIERRIKEMASVVEDCQVYAIGHFHRGFIAEKEVVRVDSYNSKTRKEKVLHICNPSTMNTASYAEMMNLDSQLMGQTVVTIGGRRSVKEMSAKVID